jgi:hypothetical protein
MSKPKGESPTLKGILLLAQDGLHATEFHYFDDEQSCFCSICAEENRFVPTLIVVPN